jgi:hypothetical protein
MGCNKCKSRAERAREKQVKKLVEEGIPKDKAEVIVPKTVIPRFRWLQFLGTTTFIFILGWVIVETLIYIFSYFFNLFF